MSDVDTCAICGLEMVGGPSMGGDRVCGWCDCGIDRDGTKWGLEKTTLMIGKGSVFGKSCKGDVCATCIGANAYGLLDPECEDCGGEGYHAADAECDRVNSHPGEHSSGRGIPSG